MVPTISSIDGNWQSVGINFTPVTGCTEYPVYFKKASESAFALHHVHPVDNPYIYVPGLDEVTAYDFYITAQVSGVESEPSNTVSFTTTHRPPIE
jgi:hypothetical protein